MNKKELKEQVEYVLSCYAPSRNSDINLTIELWTHFYPEKIIRDSSCYEPVIKLSSLFELPREDNIKRIRAKIQNVDKLYLPTDIEVFISRAKSSKEWRSFLGYKNHWTDKDWESCIKEYIKAKQVSLF